MKRKMNKNKTKLKFRDLKLAVLAVLILFFSGCSVGGEVNQNNIGIGSSSGSNVGSGVSLEFSQGAPPENSIINTPITFAFIFKNYQNHEISDLVVKITDIDWGLVSGLNKEYSISNIPKAIDGNPGIFAGLVVEGVTIKDFKSKNFLFTPKFKYYYTAKTSFLETICVPDKLNNCKVQYEKAKNENGPVTVSILRIMNTGNEVLVSLDLKNTGPGKVFGGNFNREEYLVPFTIEEVNLGSVSGQCTSANSNDLNFINQNAKLNCKFPISDGESSYSSQFYLKISYKYLQETSKKINVENLAYNQNN
jgi:hypothetical protein